MARAPTELLLKQLRDGMDGLKARMEADEANRHLWIKEWIALQEKLCSLKAEEVEFFRVAGSEATAHEVFDEMDVKDDVTALAKLVAFSAPGASHNAVQMLFDGTCHKVTWDEEMQAEICTHEGLLQQLALGVNDEDTKGSAHVLLNVMSSQDVAQEVYDELPGKIVWDEEMPTELNMNNDVLQLLASGGGHLDDEQVVDGSSGIMEFRLVEADYVFVQEFDENSKPVCEASMDDELTLERNTHFLLGFGKDHVNKMPVNVNSHDGLSQQLASGREYVYDAKIKPNIEPDFGLSPPVSTQEEMGIGSLVRAQEQALIRHRFGQGNGTIIVLEEMTVLKELYKFKNFYLLVIVANKLVHMLDKAIGPGKYRIEAEYLFLSETPSWQKDGFSPWSKGNMFQELMKFAENVDAVFFGLFSTRPWDPGVRAFQFLIEFKVVGCVVNEVQPWTRNAFSPGQIEQSHQLHWEQLIEQCLYPDEMVCCFNFKPSWRWNAFSSSMEAAMSKVMKLHQENGGLIYKVQSVRYVTSERSCDPDIPINIALNMTKLSRLVQLTHKSSWAHGTGARQKMLSVQDMKFMRRGHAFAWGQAKFSGGGNVTPVMERIWFSALTDEWAHHPWDPGGRQDKSIYCWRREERADQKSIQKHDLGFPFVLVLGGDISRHGDLVGGHGRSYPVRARCLPHVLVLTAGGLGVMTYG